MQLNRAFPEIAQRIADRRAIISFRNILLHGYDRVEDDVVWGIVQAHLPRLLSDVNTRIETESPDT